MPTSRISIGQFVFHQETGELSSPDSTTRLSPKASAVLTSLIKANGQLVSRESLHESVWAGQIVSDPQVSKAINEIRQALNDRATTSEYIETLPKRGYRLMVPVVEDPSRQPAGYFTSTKLWISGALALLAAVICSVLWLEPTPKQSTTPVRASSNGTFIAVLPFKANTPDGQPWADVVTQDIRTKIADNSPLQLVESAAQPAYVLSGSTRIAENELMVSVELLATENGHIQWSKRLTAPMPTPMQFTKAPFISAMAQNIIGLQFLRELYPHAPEAIELHIKSMTEYQDMILGGGGNFRVAEAYAKQALEVNPDFDAAHILLAVWYALRLHGDISADEALPLAHKHISKWLSFEPDQTYGLALVNRLLDLDYTAALQNLQHAERHVHPPITLGNIKVQYCYVYLMTAELERAEDACQQALALDANPQRAEILKLLGWISRLQGRPTVAMRYLEEARESESNVSTATLIGTFVSAQAANDFTTANAALDELLAMRGIDPIDYVHFVAMSGREQLTAQLIEKAEASYAEGRLSNFGPLFYAYLHQQEWDKTLFWLNKAIENREGTVIVEIKSATYLQELRNQPGFKGVMERLRQIEANGSRTVSVAMSGAH